jgi:hypothetical protein
MSYYSFYVNNSIHPILGIIYYILEVTNSRLANGWERHLLYTRRGRAIIYYVCNSRNTI